MQTGAEGEKNARFLEIARKETERVSHIIRQMLGFARRSGEVDWADVNQILEETLILSTRSCANPEFASSGLDPLPPNVRARADQLRQVFLNLLLNAQQAIKTDGEIHISTGPAEQALQPSVVIEISDSGVGIGEDDIPRIFEPSLLRAKRELASGCGLLTISFASMAAALT